MEDEEFDPCESVWSHQAMQRLISILRQTQHHCTENECYPVARLPGPPNEQPSADAFFMTIIVAVMALLYVFRPNSLRQNGLGNNNKTHDNAPGSNGDPPGPPPTAN